MPVHDRETKLLDRILADEPPETKARVLDLVVKLGIDPQDELFLFCIALGHLHVIVEDSPMLWRSVFTDFHNDLDLWTDTTLESLELSRQEAQSLSALATNFNLLAQAFKTFVQSCKKSTAHSSALLTSLMNSIRHSNQELLTHLIELKTLYRMQAEHSPRRPSSSGWTSNDSLPWLITWGLLVAGFSLLYRR